MSGNPSEAAPSLPLPSWSPSLTRGDVHPRGVCQSSTLKCGVRVSSNFSSVFMEDFFRSMLLHFSSISGLLPWVFLPPTHGDHLFIGAQSEQPDCRESILSLAQELLGRLPPSCPRPWSPRGASLLPILHQKHTPCTTAVRPQETANPMY